MGDEGLLRNNRQRSSSIGNIRDFCSPRSSLKRGTDQRSPKSQLENINKKTFTESDLRSKDTKMTLKDSEYTSEGMASIIAEIQKLENKFDKKEKKEREDSTHWVEEMVEQMKRDNDLRQKELDSKWEGKEKQDKERDRRQD
ncbi:hypothetical protein QAD02_007909 [Eretmocerus hayati]|uniref:Uncharacterized protein n=1 Tax=Eretmocerus hayati TaxID=131215 RepID=A0ACC2N597_9HYME|nr:hypothetical protein QAD02_007909 [Eretmocerus hayati]